MTSVKCVVSSEYISEPSGQASFFLLSELFYAVYPVNCSKQILINLYA